MENTPVDSTNPPALLGARWYDGAHWGLLPCQPCKRDGGDTCTHNNTRSNCIQAVLKSCAEHWGPSFSALCTAFIPRRLGECLQDVWVVKTPAEVSFDFVAASYVCFASSLSSFQALYFSRKEYVGQSWRLLHTGQALPVQLPVVGNGVQPCVTVVSCHFLGFLEKRRPVSAP